MSLLLSTNRSSRPTAGFTLVEILIVVAIITISLGVSSVYLSSFRSGNRVTIEASQLTAILKAAQEKSASQENDSRWGVYIDNPASGQGTYTLYMVEEAYVGSGVPGTPMEVRTLQSGTIFTTPASGNNTNIVFERSTGLPTSAASIILDTEIPPSNIVTVYVNANGQIEYQ